MSFNMIQSDFRCLGLCLRSSGLLINKHVSKLISNLDAKMLIDQGVQ